MKKRLLPLMLLAGGSLFAETHFSIGIGLRGPAYYPPPPVVVDSRPPYPGPGYSWVDGYSANGDWSSGYWAPPYNSYYDAPAYPVYRHDRDWDGDDHDRARGWDRGDRDRARGRGWDRNGEGDHNRGRGYGNGFRR